MPPALIPILEQLVASGYHRLGAVLVVVTAVGWAAVKAGLVISAELRRWFLDRRIAECGSPDHIVRALELEVDTDRRRRRRRRRSGRDERPPDDAGTSGEPP